LSQKDITEADSDDIISGDTKHQKEEFMDGIVQSTLSTSSFGQGKHKKLNSMEL